MKTEKPAAICRGGQAMTPRSPVQLAGPDPGAAAALTPGPAFDYSGLDRPTADALHWAEGEICTARRDYVARLAQAVYIAHDALCGGASPQCGRAHNNQHSEDTFRLWCESVGLGKTTAYKLLQVAALLNGSTPEEQAVLEAAGPSLLYAAAKPSAPAQLVQGVKDGDITTHKQYQELLAQLKAREQELAEEKAAHKAESAAFSEAFGDEQRLRREADEARRAAEEARRAAEKAAQGAKESHSVARKKEALAIRRAKEAEGQLTGAREALAAAKTRGDHWQQKYEALAAQTAAPTIEAKVVDPEELDRLAQEKARELAARQLAQREEEDARSAYDAVVLASRSVDAAWKALAPMLPRLAPGQRADALHRFVNQLMNIKEEALKCL